MRVQTVIEALQQEDPNSEIMVQWFTKEDVESNNETKYTDEHWNLAVALFDKWETGQDDLGIADCLDEAAARMEVSA